MGYLQSIGVNLEDIGMLVVSELVGSPSMGEMTREGFVEGWLSTGYVNSPFPTPVVFTCFNPRCPPILPSRHHPERGPRLTLHPRFRHHSADSTDRQKRHVASLLRTLPSDPAHFARVYKHTFAIARPPSARTLPLDMAVEYWKVLFASPSSPTQWTARAGGGVPWLEHWTAFLTTRWNKAVNRDVWDQTLKFAQRCVADPSLAWWSEESAWPGVVDEFVEWLRAEKGVGRREGRGTAEEPMEIE